MNKYFFVIILLISAVLMGCTSTDNNVFSLPDKKIDEIKITCAEQCQKSQLVRFETISFQNEDIILLFKEALENGENIQGFHMYSPEFEVLISFSDNSTMEILLSLGNGMEKEGSFVFDSEGYVIPIQDANNLRDTLSKYN